MAVTNRNAIPMQILPTYECWQRNYGVTNIVRTSAILKILSPFLINNCFYAISIFPFANYQYSHLFSSLLHIEMQRESNAKKTPHYSNYWLTAAKYQTLMKTWNQLIFLIRREGYVYKLNSVNRVFLYWYQCTILCLTQSHTLECFIKLIWY